MEENDPSKYINARFDSVQSSFDECFSAIHLLKLDPLGAYERTVLLPES